MKRGEDLNGHRRGLVKAAPVRHIADESRDGGVGHVRGGINPNRPL
jgi:hypothetical protein